MASLRNYPHVYWHMDFHLTTFASRTCPRQIRPITLRAWQRSRSRHVSSEPQRVSAALASGVNPGAGGAPNHSFSVAQTYASGPTTSIAGGRDNSAGAGGSALPASAEQMAKALGAGWLELWYQPKIGSQTLDLRGAEALIPCATHNLGSTSLLFSCPGWRRGFYRCYRNSSLPGHSPTGATS